MALGALLDLGVPVDAITRALDAVGIGGERLRVRRCIKGGVSATDVVVDVSGGHDHDHDHSHEHGHHHHGHHPYRAIRESLEGADLDLGVRERALDIFDRIARAEAAIHGTSVEDVEFHEVGAIDSIVDVVGAAAALAYLAPASVTASSVAVGHGTVHTAHGRLPVPAPATLAILREAGAVMHDGGVARELCTPTGAAILASAVTSWSPMPALTPAAIGYGAGDADLDDRPNVMRAWLGRPTGAAKEDGMYRVEANIDDMSPELAEAAADALARAGAVDVWLTPIVMKKSRPAVQLAALAPEAALEACLGAIFSETTTIGVRYERVARRVLDRSVVRVETRYGAIPVKVARHLGEEVNAAPEYEACREAARRAEVAVKQVMTAALAAYHRR
jgi:pyridinium-3,5-bisthiocarboxylic acid mononucleotide nickel chelatase